MVSSKEYNSPSVPSNYAIKDPQEERVARRIIRWIFFNFLFALFPFASSLYINSRSGKSTFEAWSNSPEILFFGLMLCATAVGDIFEISPTRWNTFFTICGFLLFLSAIALAAQYGNFLHSLVTTPSAVQYRYNILSDSWYPIVAVVALSSLVEFLLGLVEENAK